MIDEKEITRILENFEAWMARPGHKEVRCKLCLLPNRMYYNRVMLERSKNDRVIARALNLEPGSVRHHRVDCLVTRGGASPSAVESDATNKRKRFPLLAKEVTQKKWFLDELICLRNEAQQKDPPDRRELFKLAKEINKAASDYQKAKAEAKLNRPSKTEPEEDLELSDSQKREMELVNKKQEVNGADTNRSVS